MTAYLLNLAILASIFGMLASSLNIIIGYAGIFSVAHAAFFGIGAFAGAQIGLQLVPDLLLSYLFAGAIAAGLSLCLALPALRVRDEYFVIISLGLQMVAVTVFAEAQPITGGMGGLVGIPLPQILGIPIRGSWAILAVCIVTLAAMLLVTSVLMRGSYGRSLMAIRDNETAAAALGKNVALIKTLAVTISSAFAGIAGVLFAYYISFVNVESFTLNQSMLIVAMIIIGGTGTLSGPIVGAILLLLLPAALTFLPWIPPTEVGVVQQAIYGLAMILLMIFRPAGLVGRT